MEAWKFSQMKISTSESKPFQSGSKVLIIGRVGAGTTAKPSQIEIELIQTPSFSCTSFNVISIYTLSDLGNSSNLIG